MGRVTLVVNFIRFVHVPTRPLSGAMPAAYIQVPTSRNQARNRHITTCIEFSVALGSAETGEMG